ncbi:hypothetical protein SynPROSU1_02618 [Synechococcus sp. PROS-U-1]|nr:hypothetical protein SynPROSU1_02618 [Synechococcus sp. PROS-U-1]
MIVDSNLPSGRFFYAFPMSGVIGSPFTRSTIKKARDGAPGALEFI